MKKLALVTLLFTSLAIPAAAGAQCVTLKSGTILYSGGHYLGGTPIKPGFDVYGYNYQAHLFNGSYANVYLGGDGLPPYDGDDAAYLAASPAAATKWYWPYRSVTISMKWNEAWLSNMDCDANGLLDRHYGYPSYIGSGAWETNHQSGMEDGVHWSYFVKIVAAPSDATKTAGLWRTADQVEIGPDIWGEFATIQEVYNDPAAGAHGLLYKSPASPGFGPYQPE